MSDIITDSEYVKEQEEKLLTIRSEVLKEMEERDCTTHQLAKGTGLAYHTVHDFLTARRVPKLDTIMRIARYLSIMINL
jgi:transcriptional regulator with XRE-family HTH domain